MTDDEQIIITVAPTGATTVAVKGCAGPSCKDLSRDIERALGRTTTDAETDDYRRQAEVVRKART